MINNDNITRELSLNTDLTSCIILVDSNESGTRAVSELSGAVISPDKIIIDALSAVIIKK